MTTFVQDLRYGLRMLAKNPSFTAIAVLTLALGIGATTAIFSVVDGVLLRPLPYPQPEQIVAFSQTYRGKLDMSGFTAKQFDFWKSHAEPFQFLAASTSVGFNLAGGSRPERVRALRVSTEYFRVLGVPPVLGREFLPDEDRPAGPDVALLSNGLWKQDFGADRQVIGRTIQLDGESFTVVGVMPAGFESLPAVDLWTTIGQVAHTIGSGSNYELVGRLKDNVSLQQANSYLGVLTPQVLGLFKFDVPPNVLREMRYAVFPYHYVDTYQDRAPLLTIFGAIGLVLLIACVNVANLQLSRAATRYREIAVRTTIGASRWRVFRQLLIENVMLALLGAAAGLLVAQWGFQSLLALTPAGLPYAQAISLDGWTLGFVALTAIVAGILFGLAPAVQVFRADVNEILKESGGRAISGRHGLGSALAVGEVALSLVLLIGSGLLIKTFVNLLRVDLGFQPEHVLSLQIWTVGAHYKSNSELATLHENIVRRLEAVPGVESASVIAAGLPLERGGNVPVKIAGQKASDIFSVDYREVTPEYFRTLGVPVREGRVFTPSDNSHASNVAAVNAAFARQYFAGRSAVGEHVDLTMLGDAPREIVGVVGDVRSSLKEDVPPTVFIPLAQASYGVDQLFQGWFPISVLVRTVQKPLALQREVESALREVAPDIPIGQVRSMEDVLSYALAKQRFSTILMTVFAGLALVLAAVGLYGVISYSVSQRTHEIGIRVAVGAQRQDVLRLVVGEGLRLVVVGLAIGIAGALALTRFLSNILFGVRSGDPVTFAAVSLLLAVVALLAAYFPARRAAKVDPLAALRHE